MSYIICHYSEIGLKGKNRRFFEEQLIKNIKQSLSFLSDFDVFRISGRILIKLRSINEKEKQEIIEKLGYVFGISGFSFAQNTKQDIKDISSAIYKELKNKKFKTFKIKAKRSDKRFFLSSQEINEQAGKYILEKFKNIEVDLSNPDVVCFVEIVEKYAFVFTERFRGLGGLPVKTSGKAICLISGGIDSPVAAFYALKRGVEVVFLHFHSYPVVSDASIEKVKEVAQTFKKYQKGVKLYIVPLIEIQKQVLSLIPAKLRLIFYRRFMFKIAEIIAEKEKAEAIITGESIGQVASQTLENIRVIEESVKIPVLRPLIGQNKEEIISKAKEIKTYQISILPHDDCCSLFLAKHPATKASIKEVLEEEKKLKSNFLIKKAIKELTYLNI